MPYTSFYVVSKEGDFKVSVTQAEVDISAGSMSGSVPEVELAETSRASSGTLWRFIMGWLNDRGG